ncbi:hypothetical protein SPRG_06107 [Saprolegnia parasitica CBS 223.65]|uniref:Uncharacterized protein n=1 Tax=Saprolegnia parasitica (strain CBS 223.65) TaxID=695850 RepID=A0A067CQF5_SAPPC|nr:hypothetical protein SPRG_06107 [Saprolegnia parasitica CBS 223.65]KDO29052.1 hypothetical protein SPRG_06107 [Saprolegnia parasitica CBS 223.65]|eukprot:XP_012200222.1 hypothetical protein SPRG_06107 [Saprolegnia parasitica CBS 223.65]
MSTTTVPTTKATKTVTWATTTVHEFELGHSPSSVPSTGGPGLGLMGKPVATHTAPVADRLGSPRSHEELYLAPMKRIECLRDLGFSIDEIAVFCIETNQARTERHESEQEYIQQMRQKQYEAQVMRQHMMQLEMQRQRQLYLQMHYQLQYQSQLPAHPRSSSSSSSRDVEPKVASRRDIHVIDNKRRRLSVEAMLN